MMYLYQHTKQRMNSQRQSMQLSTCNSRPCKTLTARGKTHRIYMHQHNRQMMSSQRQSMQLSTCNSRPCKTLTARGKAHMMYLYQHNKQRMHSQRQSMQLSTCNSRPCITLTARGKACKMYLHQHDMQMMNGQKQRHAIVHLQQQAMQNTNCQRGGIASLRATAWHATYKLPGASMQTRRVKACEPQTARDRACTSYLQQQNMRRQKAGHASSGKAGYATIHAIGSKFLDARHYITANEHLLSKPAPSRSSTCAT